MAKMITMRAVAMAEATITIDIAPLVSMKAKFKIKWKAIWARGFFKSLQKFFFKSSLEGTMVRHIGTTLV